MAKGTTALIAYGVLGFVGYKLAASGTFGGGAKSFVGNLRLPGLGGAGQSQSSGTATGGSPSQQAAPSGQNQVQPSSTTAYTGPNSFQGGSGPGAAGVLVVQGFVQAYGLDPSDHSSAWVNYYRQQFGSWPDEDLVAGNANPADLYNYAVNAIGYLQSIGAA